MSGLADTYDLRDEEQVKEYLKNLGTEYRFQCYKEHIPAGCHRLADFFEAFKRDLPKARKVYKENCDDNKYGHSCFKIGNYNMVGKAGPEDQERALYYHNLGCDYGYMASCHNVALLHHLGKVDGKKDYRKSVEFLERGCAGDNIPSCHLLSTYYISGKDGVPKDMTKAFKYAKKACDMGHMYACANLSQMYKKGDGTDKNLELAERYKEKAKILYKDATEVQNTMTFGK